MNKRKFLFLFTILSTLLISFSFIKFKNKENRKRRIISYVVHQENKNLRLFWKNSKNSRYSSINNLKKELNQRGIKLKFAMNGGMFQKDQTPLGLYIENGKLLHKLNRKTDGYGNFYMQPGGIFYIDNNNKGHITSLDKFKSIKNIKHATQSGPMLITNGKYHPKFRNGSTNLNIRNGVGILPNGDLIFAISKEEINFYDFASFFKEKECKNALYLDGFVSRAYIPSENWKQLDGNFGVIIAETD